MRAYVFKGVGLATVALSTSQVAGFVINWNESTDGDLGELYQFSAPSGGDLVVNFGPIGIGTHTFVGTNLQTSGGTNRFEGDAIRFSIPVGLQLEDIVFQHDRAAGLREFLMVSGSSTLATYVFRTFPAYYLPGPTESLIDYTPVGPPSRPAILPGVQSLGPGEYLLSWDNQTFNTTMNYTLQLVVTPAPGAMALLAGGSMVLARRRRPSTPPR